MKLWQEWWVWVTAGVALAILETLIPGYVLLGFACGAVLTGVLISVGVMGTSLAPALLVFAVASLASWWLLKRTLGEQRDPNRVFRDDINKN